MNNMMTLVSEDHLGGSAVVLLSGGMDSATALGLAVHTHDDVHAISFDYGQRHRAELEAARALAQFYNIENHLVVKLDRRVLEGFGSPLVEKDVAVQEMTYAEMKDAQGMAQTVVPNRNMLMMSHAVAYAMAKKLDLVYIGAHAEDARNFAYSDCTPEFNMAMGSAIGISTYGKVFLNVPFQDYMKGDIVKLGIKLAVPYHMTLSCYNGTVPACGKCPTCVERLAAFEYAGTPDPIRYERS